MRSRLTILGAALLLALATPGAQAQAPYPERTVHLVVPNPPGGVTDLLARIIAQRLSQIWGQAVVVDNRPGGDETIAADSVARAAPDGHTLGFVASGAPLDRGARTYRQGHPLRSVQGFLARVALGPESDQPGDERIDRPPLPVRSVAAADRASPRRSRARSTTARSATRAPMRILGMEDFKQRTGAGIVHIPYKGSAPAIAALLRNEVSVLIVNEATIDPHVKDGKVRIIAAAGARRAAAFPDLPTIAETVPGFSTGSYWGLYGPANLPPAVIDRIRADVGAILAGPEARKLFETNSLEPIDMSARRVRRLPAPRLRPAGRAHQDGRPGRMTPVGAGFSTHIGAEPL